MPSSPSRPRATPARLPVAVLIALALALGLAPAAGAQAPAAAPQASLDRASSAAVGPITVRLRVGNAAARRVATNRSWATGVLADQGVGTDRDDRIVVRRNGNKVRKQERRRLRDGDTVRVVWVKVRSRSHRTRIKRATRTRTVARLEPGQRRVVRSGRPGVRRVTIIRTRHNGAVVKRTRSTRVLRAPRARRVLVGRRTGSVAGANHLDWRALARCESSGNPRAVNPAGYYGLYQFNVATWRSVGGSGLPSRASAAQQTYRAKLLYRSRGRSPWPHCGRYL